MSLDFHSPSLGIAKMVYPRSLVAFKIIFYTSFIASNVFAFDNTRNDNLAVYWGQNSYGATHSSDTANWQQRLSYYCQDDTINAFPVAFVDVFFGEGGVPSLDLANICNTVDNAVFPGTELPDCSFLATDIQTCQSQGKIVTISLGGATGAVGFTSDSQAQTFADTIWNVFLGGSSSTRPFGDAILDGVDLDIEGGSSASYPAFINQIRSHASGASKQYYITGAPQCPFPDAALGSVINAVAFDALYVQFYNNYCGLNSFSNPNDWDFETWDNWAKTAPNNKVKIYIGAPASSSAAGSGYVDSGTLANIIQQTRNTYSSFGGVMLWDASQAYANNRFDVAVKNALTGSSGGGTTSSPVSSSTKTSSTSKSSSSSSSTTKPSSSNPTSSTSKTSTTSTAGEGQCAGVPSWASNVAYNGGAQVVYGGHLWTAKWWSEADTPGGPADDWQDDGACTSSATAHVHSTSTQASIAITTSAASRVGQTTSAGKKETATSKPTIASIVPKQSSPATKANTSSPAESTVRQHSRFFKRSA